MNLKAMGIWLKVTVLVSLAFSLVCPELLAQGEKKPEVSQVELGLVEKVAQQRIAYRRSIIELLHYYTRVGNEEKRKRAQQEVDGFNGVIKPEYVVLADVVSPDIKPIKSIPEADKLYKDGMEYKGYPSFFGYGKKKKLELALEKFKEVMLKYPESDKCDDAAYRIAQVYEGVHFRNPTLAVKYYQKCFEWDPKTPHDARYRAAVVYELKLKDLDKAIALYKLAIEGEPAPKTRRKAQKRLDEIIRKLKAEQAKR